MIASHQRDALFGTVVDEVHCPGRVDGQWFLAGASSPWSPEAGSTRHAARSEAGVLRRCPPRRTSFVVAEGSVGAQRFGRLAGTVSASGADCRNRVVRLRIPGITSSRAIFAVEITPKRIPIPDAPLINNYRPFGSDSTLTPCSDAAASSSAGGSRLSGTSSVATSRARSKWAVALPHAAPGVSRFDSSLPSRRFCRPASRCVSTSSTAMSAIASRSDARRHRSGGHGPSPVRRRPVAVEDGFPVRARAAGSSWLWPRSQPPCRVDWGCRSSAYSASIALRASAIVSVNGSGAVTASARRLGLSS